MASKIKLTNKKTIIALAVIIVLLVIAVTGTVVFLKDRGSTEAAEITSQQENGRIENEDQGTQSNEQVANEGNNPENAQNVEQEVAQNDGAEGTSANDATQATTTTGGATVGTATTGTSTTGTGTTTTENIQESTIIRTETEEVMVSEDFLVGWNPLSVNVDEASAKINAQETDIEVVKTAKTKSGENLVYAGEEITYTIKVTNKSENDLNSIEISDTIPAQTTLKSIDNDGVEAQGKIKWEKDIKANETVEVSFTVTVNEGATGTIRNIAIANGEESKETKTAIIESEKTSKIERDGKEVQEPAKVGDTVTYTITVKNTGEIEGTTNVHDKALDDLIKNGILKIEEGSEENAQKLINGMEVKVPANGVATISVVTKILKVDGAIKNVATVGEENPEETIDTVNITGTKVPSTAQVKVGEEFSYTITLTNTGNKEGESTITDQIPDGTEFVRAYQKVDGENDIEISKASLQNGYKVTVPGKVDDVDGKVEIVLVVKAVEKTADGENTSIISNTAILDNEPVPSEDVKVANIKSRKNK